MGAGKKRTLNLAPVRDDNGRRIVKALKRDKKAKAKLTMKLSDDAGNKAPSSG
jgi:hypothetical protein